MLNWPPADPVKLNRPADNILYLATTGTPSQEVVLRVSLAITLSPVLGPDPSGTRKEYPMELFSRYPMFPVGSFSAYDISGFIAVEALRQLTPVSTDNL